MTASRSVLLIVAAFALAIVAESPVLTGAEAPPKLLVTHATVVTLDDTHPAPFSGYLLVGADGRIQAIGEGEAPAGLAAAETYDAAGKVIMPGFLSGHSHLWQSAFRGIAADKWVMDWVQALHRTYGPYFVKGDPYAFTLHGALDYLRHGITTTFNYSQNLNFTPELYGEQLQAELDAGGRFIFGYAPPARLPLDEIRKQFTDFYAHAKLEPSPLLLKVSLLCDGFTPEYANFVFGLSREFGLDVQMHYLESPDSKVQQDNFGIIEKAGGLGPKLVFAHFIHTTDLILGKAGAAGAGMIWNPLSNGRLGSGLADIPKYRKAGIRVGMGLDGQASADIADPFENMRMGVYGLRMKYESAAIMMPIDVLKLHTIGTAEVLGVSDRVGTLTPGKFADFLVVDPGNFDTGPVYDLYATLVFACKISNLERVYVGGDWVAERGRLLHQDFPKLTREVQARVATVRQKMTAALPHKP